MNDDLIVIGSYPNTVEKEIILENCIKQLKKTNKDILLVSHYPVRREIQQLVNYFIYDTRNPMLDQSDLYWHKSKNFYFQTKLFGFGSHSFSILLSIQNAVCFAKNLNKKVFYYFEGDCFISDKDLQNIDLLKNEVYKKGKRGYIQTDTHGGDVRNNGVCMLFFMFEIDFFYENFDILQSCDEYKNKVINGITLEFYFHQNLSKNIAQLDVENNSSLREKTFPNSHFNLTTFQLNHLIDILPEEKSKKAILVITNAKKNNREYRISFLRNDNIIGKAEVSLLPGGYYYNILNEEIKYVHVFYKENNNWKLVYDKDPRKEVKNKIKCEYVRIG